MKNHFNIALDGPSGAGKSTVAKMLSARLGILYLDTGALYRAIGLKAYLNNWPEESSLIESFLANTDIKVKYDRDTNTQKVFLDGKDVSKEIRQDFVSGYASRFSALPSVRKHLLGLQREISKEYSSVLDGRDIGTCVIPNAEIKIYLTATSDERARRRTAELIQRGMEADFEKVKADIEERDYRDSHREIAPLKKADDAIEIVSDGISAEQVTDKIIDLVNKL
ncbi:MAG: (d)CMP kinase [Clostridia bacterium]|nr:(d)CMP kinase [Clostridia bacterium]MBP5593026.1 (d)CMP kinase [Clostridia bacterium]MBP5648973.1 (d)CMP kinase [Clostridia bacterium]